MNMQYAGPPSAIGGRALHGKHANAGAAGFLGRESQLLEYRPFFLPSGQRLDHERKRRRIVTAPNVTG
jgi:hypothetical protein